MFIQSNKSSIIDQTIDGIEGLQMSLDLVTELFGHNDRVWCVRWHPSGHTLASCGADKTIRLWAKEGMSDDMVKPFAHQFDCY